MSTLRFAPGSSAFGAAAAGPARNAVPSARSPVASVPKARSRDDSKIPGSVALALTVMFPRMCAVLLTGPIVVLALPIVPKFGYALLSLITGGHVLMPLVIMVLGTMCFRKWIYQVAPSKRDAENALASSAVVVPLGLLVVSSAVIRFGVWWTGITFSKSISMSSWIYGLYSSRISFCSAMQVAIGMFFLGLAVLLRYSGVRRAGDPCFAPARCSALPLASTHAMPTDFRSFIIWATRPASSTFATGNNPGLRYRSLRPRHPNFIASMIHLAMTGICGLIVAFVSAVPLTSGTINGTSLYRADDIITCLLAVIVDAVESQLWGGRSHELDIKRYSMSIFNRQSISILARGLARRILWKVLLIPCLAAAAIALFTNTKFDTEPNGVLHIAFTSLWTTLLLSAYLQIFDLIFRVIVVASAGRTDLAALVENEENDRNKDMLAYLGICMDSILHAHMPTMESVVGSARQSVVDNEMLRSARSRTAMASFMLEGADEYRNIMPFEEDILRLDILISLGGLADFANCFDISSHPIQHIHAQQWLCSSENLAGEPIAMPLIRSLCAYAGGFGHALSLVSKSSPKSWSLPPGAVVALECSIRAAGRFLVWKATGNWNSSRQVVVHKNVHSSINTLVPAVLDAAYRLQRGIDDHTKRCREELHGSPELVRSYVDMISPVSRACNDVVLGVLERAQDLNDRRLRLDRNLLDRECLLWVDGLLG